MTENDHREEKPMAFQMFHEMCPEVGLRETRSVTLPANSADGLLSDDYAFLEMYWTEAGCDCRRVYFQVGMLPYGAT
jgi:hypothetical protein